VREVGLKAVFIKTVFKVLFSGGGGGNLERVARGEGIVGGNEKLGKEMSWGCQQISYDRVQKGGRTHFAESQRMGI